MPVVPPAPVTFSITICCPSVRDMCSATMRAMTSVGPPAAKGTIMVIGRSGYAARAAAGEARTAARARDDTSDFIGSLLSLREDLLAPLPDGRDDREREHDEGGGEQARADRAVHERGEIAAREDERAPQVLLHQ